MKLRSVLVFALFSFALRIYAVDDFKPEPGFVSLFNGKDLTGWSYSATDTFDGKAMSSDNRFEAKDGVLIVHPKAPRDIKKILTVREFPKDFILKLEFRAAVAADSGVFIRGPQLQCRDYLVAGPYKELKQYRAQDWNEIEVVVKDGVARCTCNGELLTDALKVPPTGPIGLEADQGQLEYRRIRLKEF
ncbi:MAG: DUF1080 domain-containing protein [Opitutaceae bacterium]